MRNKSVIIILFCIIIALHGLGNVLYIHNYESYCIIVSVIEQILVALTAYFIFKPTAFEENNYEKI